MLFVRVEEKTHSLKIHQAKMRCLIGKQVELCTGPAPGETQEERQQSPTVPRPSIPHQPYPKPGTQNSKGLSGLPPIRKAWHQFNEDVDQVLEATAREVLTRRYGQCAP